MPSPGPDGLIEPEIDEVQAQDLLAAQVSDDDVCAVRCDHDR